MIAALFFISGGLLVYSYLLYPVALALVAKLRDSTSHLPNLPLAGWPLVSTILSVYNEAGVIEAKIRNFLESKYPGRFELLIVSDGSSDRTVEIATQLADDRVRVFDYRDRLGKGAQLNRAIAQARGAILAFTDANAFFTPETLTELARPFADSRIGLVTGGTRYSGAETANAYQRYEQLLKSLESTLGVVATADGAVYALRRSLWHESDPRLINDFLHPIMVSLAGARSCFAPKAVCTEEFELDNEFGRQVRMVGQAAYVYFRFLPELIRAGCWTSVVVLTSHKLLRWFTVPWLSILLVSTLLLAPKGGIYLVALVTEFLFVLLVTVGALGGRFGLGERAGFAFRFLTLNWAGAIGVWRCLLGRVPTTWEPRSS